MECDVVVIGAGPAGLFAAFKLARDFKVIVIDKGKYMGEECVFLLKMEHVKNVLPVI